MATPNYDIDYNDKRFTEVETDKKAALTETEKTYSGMINQSDAHYQKQIDAVADYAETQKKNQQAQTDFAIEQIEQQKDQANKDYIKEQSGAYVDWQKESNKYGANAEQMASAGLAGAGYSESSQVSMFNTYQNRVATAREAYSRAVLNYDNAIKDARLQNNSVLAEIAYNALQKQLELSLQGFQYKNTLVLEKAKQKREIDSEYYARYKDVLSQINTENALAEEVRQYNESLKEEKRQYDATLAENKRQFAQTQSYNYAKLAEEKRQFDALHSGDSGSGSGSGSSGSGSIKGTSTSNSKNRITASGKKLLGSFKTYERATEYLEKQGVKGYTLMTNAEWTIRKASYKETGIGGYEVSANKTYADYLKTSVEHALANK